MVDVGRQVRGEPTSIDVLYARRQCCQRDHFIGVYSNKSRASLEEYREVFTVYSQLPASHRRSHRPNRDLTPTATARRREADGHHHRKDYRHEHHRLPHAQARFIPIAEFVAHLALREVVRTNIEVCPEEH